MAKPGSTWLASSSPAPELAQATALRRLQQLAQVVAGQRHGGSLHGDVGAGDADRDPDAGQRPGEPVGEPELAGARPCLEKTVVIWSEPFQRPARGVLPWRPGSARSWILRARWVGAAVP